MSEASGQSEYTLSIPGKGTYNWGSRVFGRADQMLDQVAADYLDKVALDADVSGEPMDMSDYNYQLADQCIQHWGLDRDVTEDGITRSERNHMDAECYDRHDLADAFDRVRNRRSGSSLTV